MSVNKWAIIVGEYLNGWGLADAIRAAGWRGRILCLYRGADPFTVMSLYRRGVQVWRVPLDEDLHSFLTSRIPQHDHKVLFFTEEQSLESVLNASSEPWFATAAWFPGAACRLPEILDRLKFYERIVDRDLGLVPRTIDGRQNPFKQFDEPFFLRFRRTWLRGRRTPRVRLVTSRSEWRDAVEQSEQLGYSPDDWCYQEALSLDPGDNVSVCGWHDVEDPRYVATHKVLQFPFAQGNGDVCEVLPLTGELSSATRGLLNELTFSGPFELEFIRDRQTGKHVVIELNPRFWMQHPLADANLGQVLVRRYLGAPDGERESDSPPRYWVNTVVALYRAVRGDFRAVRYLRDPAAIPVPPLWVTFRWLPRHTLNLAARRYRRRKARG